MRQVTTLCRRLTSRIEAPADVWVLWQCEGREVVSPVRDISMEGMFIETPNARPAGALAKLYFLVPDGQIMAGAVVRHAEHDSGVGLKFTAVSQDDRTKLAALITRLRT